MAGSHIRFEAGDSRAEELAKQNLLAEDVTALQDAPAGAVAWGGITGTLSDQTDLQAALDAKASTSAVAELARDALGAALVAGTNVTITPNDGADTITIDAAGGSYTDEEARDAIGAALTAGAGITITPSDPGDTITIASTITQYTDEMARDALGTALVAGSNVTITPDDGADTITIASTAGGLAFSGAKVRKAATLTAQNLTAGQLVVWTAEDWDDAAYHSLVTDTDRLTPPAAGRYGLRANIRLENCATGNYVTVAIFRYNSSAVLQEACAAQTVEISATGVHQVNLTGSAAFASGDFARCSVTVETDNSVDIHTNSYFEIWRLT